MGALPLEAPVDLVDHQVPDGLPARGRSRRLRTSAGVTAMARSRSGRVGVVAIDSIKSRVRLGRVVGVNGFARPHPNPEPPEATSSTA